MKHSSHPHCIISPWLCPWSDPVNVTAHVGSGVPGGVRDYLNKATGKLTAVFLIKHITEQSPALTSDVHNGLKRLLWLNPSLLHFKAGAHFHLYSDSFTRIWWEHLLMRQTGLCTLLSCTDRGESMPAHTAYCLLEIFIEHSIYSDCSLSFAGWHFHTTDWRKLLKADLIICIQCAQQMTEIR